MLAPFLGYVGLALATTLSATLNAVLLYQGLKHLGIYQFSSQTRAFIVKLLVSAGVMAAVVFQLSPPFEIWLELSFIQQLTKLIFCITCGVLSYFACVFLFGIRLKDLKLGAAG